MYIVDELREYFSPYGDVIECQIMIDHNSGRSRGFGFVTFDDEDSVDKVFSVGKIHEIGGKQVSESVEIKTKYSYCNPLKLMFFISLLFILLDAPV